MDAKKLGRGLAPIAITVGLILLVQDSVSTMEEILSDPAWIQIIIAVTAISYDLLTGKIRKLVRSYIGITDLSEAVQDNQEDLDKLEREMQILKIVAVDGSRAVNAIVRKFQEEYPDEDTEELITMNFDEIYKILFDETAAPGDFTRGPPRGPIEEEE